MDAKWRQETQLYDRKLLQERVQHLRAVKKGGDVHEMMFAIRADLLRNLGNMCNRQAPPENQPDPDRVKSISSCPASASVVGYIEAI